MEHGKVRVISFDCGGTLYYEVEHDYVVFHKILNGLGYELRWQKLKGLWIMHVFGGIVRRRKQVRFGLKVHG